MSGVLLSIKFAYREPKEESKAELREKPSLPPPLKSALGQAALLAAPALGMRPCTFLRGDTSGGSLSHENLFPRETTLGSNTDKTSKWGYTPASQHPNT